MALTASDYTVLAKWQLSNGRWEHIILVRNLMRVSITFAAQNPTNAAILLRLQPVWTAFVVERRLHRRALQRCELIVFCNQREAAQTAADQVAPPAEEPTPPEESV